MQLQNIDDILPGLKFEPNEAVIFSLGDISKPILINGTDYLIEKLFKNQKFQEVIQEDVNNLIANSEVIFNYGYKMAKKYILHIKNK